MARVQHRKAAKTPERITAAEFDRKFDAGEDVEEYLDLASARRPGREKEHPKKGGDRRSSRGARPAPKRITLNELNAEHAYEWLRMYWRDDARRFGGCVECEQIGRRLERVIGPASVRRMGRVVAKSRKDTAIETAGSVFFDLFEPAKALRLSIQSGLALALEREIAARKWTGAETARRLGMTPARLRDLRRRRLDTLSIDVLIVSLARLGVLVRIDPAPPKRRRRPRHSMPP